jgi:hypothetical protein
LSSFEAKYALTLISKCNDWDDAGTYVCWRFVASSII